MRWAAVALVLAFAVLPAQAAPPAETSPARELVERVLGYLGLRVRTCSDEVAAEWPDRATLCAPYGGRFSAFKLDVDSTLARHDISPAITPIEPWTFHAGRYTRVVEVEGERIVVVFDERTKQLVLALPGEKNEDLAEEVNTGRRVGPRIAGFGGVSVPRVRADSQVRPDYPVAAYRQGIAGNVTLRALILRDGSVGDVEVLRVEPDGYEFDAAAVAAVRQWRFDPATLDGEPVDAMHTLRVSFETPGEGPAGEPAPADEAPADDADPSAEDVAP
jgi:TonB family protein